MDVGKKLVRMRRYKSIIEYDGSKYHGFQLQPNAVTIQEIIQKSLSEILKEDIKITASGRTDAGVHAYGQVIHFDSVTTLPVKAILILSNQVLPDDIAMLSLSITDNNFHARFSAKKKTYLYKILLSDFQRPLYKNRYYIYPYSVDIDLMQKAAEAFEGEHNFATFMASGSNVQNTIRTIYGINIEKYDNEIWIKITANGFLYNMVRIIVGTLLEIGRGKLKPDHIDKLLNSIGGQVGPTAPACGLYLFDVLYD